MKKNFLDELKQITKENCTRVLDEKYYDLGSETYKYIFGGKLYLEAISENIALWSIECDSPIYKRKTKYFYTDLNGNILFQNFFFDYATPFSDECAVIETPHYTSKRTLFILDLRHQQLLSIPKEINGIYKIMHSNIPVYDEQSKKCGSYHIDTETGLWTQDIPFIWDRLAFDNDKEIVWVSRTSLNPYYSNDDNTPYNHMVPNHNEISYYKEYYITRLNKNQCYNYDGFLQSKKLNGIIKRQNFDSIEEAIYSKTNSDYQDNQDTTINTDSIKKYSLKLSHIKR